MGLTIVKKIETWNLHTHSRFSAKDALPKPSEIVAEVSRMGQKAIGLTDHGNMAGTVQMYQAAKREGIAPFPGTELYVVPSRDDKKAKRHHMCVVAFTTEGYGNLVKMNTLMNVNFHNKPLVDLADLADMADAGLLKGIAATSGCYFSLISQELANGQDIVAEIYAQSFANWFDRFYIELQNHNITHDEETGANDDKLADSLWAMAEKLGLPCVVTQDSHYVHREDKDLHEDLKRLVAFGPDPDDAVFPGDGFHLADDGFFASHHHARRLDAGKAGLADLLQAHSLTIPALDHYKYNIPFTVAEPQQALSDRCWLALKIQQVPVDDRYAQRLTDELAVVETTGMAGYLMMVAECTDWLRENAVFFQARGSASGSLIEYLVKTTQVDPVRLGIPFERFISLDRTKPPDVDLDVEHGRRQEFVEWLKTRYVVHQIGTWGKFSLKVEDEEAEDETKGSLRVQYYARLNAMDLPRPSWDEVPSEDKRMLERLAERDLVKSHGVHAAGLVVTSTNEEYDALVPSMLVASSKKVVSQYPMADIEALGLVKLDVLGVKMLSVLKQTMLWIGRDPFLGMDWIPLNDKEVFRLIASGDTEGMFQLEGRTAKYGCKRLKPSHINDVIAAMALFRTAAMKSGATDSFIRRKHKQESTPARHKIIDKHVKHTYGVMIYQEQVVSILRDLGMNPEDLTAFLKAIKASNDKIIEARKTIDRLKPTIIELATQHEMSADDWKWLWEAFEGFAEYGFNFAHSVVYGITAYRCAYLIVHHPVEFHAALLSVAAGSDKEERYIKATRKREIRVMAPDINASDISYTVDPSGRGVRRGLNSVDRVGDTIAREIVTKRPEAGYHSMDQMATLVNRSKVSGVKPFLEEGLIDVGAIGKLYEANAMNFNVLTEAESDL